MMNSYLLSLLTFSSESIYWSHATDFLDGEEMQIGPRLAKSFQLMGLGNNSRMTSLLSSHFSYKYAAAATVVIY